MAATTKGTSTFHEPPPTLTVADPWLVFGLCALALLGGRALIAIRGRSEEGGYWIWAAVSWAPICGLLSLPFPMADRYLYFILPGLIGAGLTVLTRSTRIADRTLAGVRLGTLIQLALLIAILGFGWRAYLRSHVWRGPATMSADSARHYPEGRTAHIVNAVRAAQGGDAARAVAELRAAHDRGYDRLDEILSASFEPIADAPEFVVLKREWAAEWISRYEGDPHAYQPQLMMLAQAYITRGELDAARRTIHRAIYVGGPLSDYLEAALESVDQLEAQLREREREPGRPEPSALGSQKREGG
jgi:hypothetical protein